MIALPRRTGLSLLVASLVLTTAAGCGGAVGTVSGEVKVKGEPMKQGSIAFLSQARKKKVVKTGEIKDGKYSVAEVPAGEVLITVQFVSPPPPEVLNPPAKPGVSAKKKKPDPKAKPELRPHPRYADAKLTDLKYTVTQGEQEHNLDLEPDPAQPKEKPGKKPGGR